MWALRARTLNNVGASRKNVKQMLALRARMVVKNVKILKN